MSLYLNATGKLILASLGAQLVSEVAKVVSEKKAAADKEARENPNTYGLPRPFYDELMGHIFSDDRKSFLAALDKAGAPTDINFRKDLWKVLGGK